MQESSGELEGDGLSSPWDDISFDELMRIAGQQVNGATSDVDRWHLLVEALATLAADLSLADLLDHVLAVAVDLTRARSAALTVTDEAAGRQRVLVSHGPAVEDVARIGGSAESPHPPRRSVLRVPLRLDERIVGTLHLTAPQDGSGFSEDDEQLVSALVAAAVVAIDHARLREGSLRRERWFAAAADLATVLASTDAEDIALQIVADRARELAGADVAWLVTGPDPAHLRLQVVSGLPTDPEAMPGLDFSRSLARCVAACGRPLTVKRLSTHPRAVDVSRALGGEPLGAGMVVPLRSAIGLEGVITLAWCADADPVGISRDASLPALLAEQAALSLHVARVRRDEQRLAVLEDRDRIAQGLHDLIMQRLFAIELELQGTASLHDPVEMGRRLDHAIEDIDTTIRDIRGTIFGLRSAPEPSAQLGDGAPE